MRQRDGGAVPASARKIRILLIENDKAFLSWAVPALNANGFDVVGVASTKDVAEDLISNRDYELALVDIELDSLDTTGFALIPQIRRSRPNARVAIFSSYLDPQS